MTDSDFSLDGLRQELREERKASDLRDSLRRALRQLEKQKLKTGDLVDAVYRAAKDGIQALDIPPVEPPKTDRRTKDEEVAVAVLSDWQLAKVTPDYDSEVCERRIELYADKLLQLTEIQRADHPVKKLRVYLVGDIVEGELIFPGQSHLIDASLYRQVTVDGPRILGNFLRRMLAEFEQVHVVGVIGNHGALGGRSRKDYDPETNADRMLYRIVQQLFASEERLTWNIPDGPRKRSWWAADAIGESFRALLFHGDQIRSYSGFPWYGFGKAVNGWKDALFVDDDLNPSSMRDGQMFKFTDAIAGHFHQACVFPLNFITVRVNGSTESTNPYAQEQLAAAGRPCQWLLYVHPKQGVTSEYRVWLDDV